VFPDTGTVSIETLNDDFRGSNLISVQLVSDKNYPLSYFSLEEYNNCRNFVPPYWRQAWLEYLGSIAKRKYELDNNIRYTNVIGCRPDCLYNVSEEVKTQLDPIAISNINYSSLLKFNEIMTPDFIWRAGAVAADVFSMRFLDSHYTDGIPNQFLHHHEFTLPPVYQLMNLLDGRVNVGDIAEQIVMPNFPLPLLQFTSDLPYLESIRAKWHELSIAEREQYCDLLKISYLDYQLPLLKEIGIAN
jgi:hypothetical protein